MTTWQWKIIIAIVRIVARSALRMTDEEREVLRECLEREK